MSHEHFIEKCTNCGGVISQCRCIDKNKTIKYSICDKCSKEALKIGTKLILSENLEKTKKKKLDLFLREECKLQEIDDLKGLTDKVASIWSKGWDDALTTIKMESYNEL